MSDHAKYVREKIANDLSFGFGEVGSERGSYWLPYVMDNLRCLTVCVNTPPKEELLAVQAFTDETLDWGTPAMEAAITLWDVTTNGRDCGSSSGQTEHYRFAYHAAHFLADVQQDSAKRAALAELQAMDKRRREIVEQYSDVVPDQSLCDSQTLGTGVK